MSLLTPPTEQHYHLKCKVIVKMVTYMDEQSKGTTQVSEELVFLIPQESDERTKFLMAWLPDTDDQHQEIGVELGAPLFAVARAALWRRTEHVNEYHLFMMTKSAEEFLKPLKNRVIDVEVLSEKEDHVLDGQRDHDLPYKKHYDDSKDENYEFDQDSDLHPRT